MSWRMCLVAAALASAGCFPAAAPAPPVHDYRLEYASPMLGESALPAVVRVIPFGAAAVYDREAIVYRENAYATGTYVYHRWMANPASMVSDLLARDLAASGAYRAVPRGLVASDFSLDGELEEIEERMTDAGRGAHLRLRVILQRARGASAEPVVFTAAYEADEACRGETAADFVAAMSRALEQISARLQRDVYGAIAKDLAGRSSAPRGNP